MTTGLAYEAPARPVPRGACCPHLLTAHTTPDGICQLCPCTRWTPEGDALTDHPEEIR